jgi:hypothetical protein
VTVALSDRLDYIYKKHPDFTSFGLYVRGIPLGSTWGLPAGPLQAYRSARPTSPPYPAPQLSASEPRAPDPLACACRWPPPLCPPHVSTRPLCVFFCCCNVFDGVGVRSLQRGGPGGSALVCRLVRQGTGGSHASIHVLAEAALLRLDGVATPAPASGGVAVKLPLIRNAAVAAGWSHSVEPAQRSCSGNAAGAVICPVGRGG